MKKSTLLALLLVPAALFANPSVESVIVRQQWPWSTGVKVEYALSGVDTSHPVDIAVRAFNGGTELASANLEAAISGERYGITDAVGSFTINPAVAFGTSQIEISNFRVELTLSPSAANINDILYKIVDLDPPYTVTDVRRKDFYHNGIYGNFVTNYTAIDSTFSTSLDDVLIWLDVTNDVYKTDKMVFRRIPAAGKSYMMQTNNPSVNGGAGVEVSFTKDFYIGVFEVTQAQMNKFYRWYGADYDYPDYPPGSGRAANNSYETNALYRAMRPATCLQFDNSNGTVLRRYDLSVTDHTQVGPAYYYIANGTLCYNMQDKTGLLIDLPTEAMWEYACRAGTTTDLYSGKDYSKAEAQKLSTMYRYPGSYYDGLRNCDLTKLSNVVGSYKPNAWGLYDMIGNAQEWCLDAWLDAENLTGGEDPVATGNTRRVQRGSGTYTGDENHTVNLRTNFSKDWGTGNAGCEDNGVRLCIYCDVHDDGTK